MTSKASRDDPATSQDKSQSAESVHQSREAGLQEEFPKQGKTKQLQGCPASAHALLLGLLLTSGMSVFPEQPSPTCGRQKERTAVTSPWGSLLTAPLNPSKGFRKEAMKSFPLD